MRKIITGNVSAFATAADRQQYITAIWKAAEPKAADVCRLANGTYAASITFQKQRHHLGTYKTLEEAADARRRGY
ncbi:MAG: hypothetical protein LIV24_03980 [Eubacterium sp.]|nr:hypothetical protein [Eubacterium sp.]